MVAGPLASCSAAARKAAATSACSLVLACPRHEFYGMLGMEGGKKYIYIYPKDPWDWHIYLHGWLKFMVNVGKYTSPMGPMGYIYIPELHAKKR